jgi:hypothetical protein
LIKKGFATPAGAACNWGDVILNGTFSHGALVCNPKWLDRKGSYVVLALSQRCRDLTSSMTKSLIKRGFDDFDRRVAELGHNAACAQLDADIRLIETAK